jgi:hypothetical protein
MKRLSSIALLPFLCGLSGTTWAAVDYVKEVKPLIATACVQCHNADQKKGGLVLDTAASALKGGDKGPVVVAGKGDRSLLVDLLQGPHGDLPQMPYKRNALGADQVALIKQWIDEGAHAPANETPSVWTHWAFIAPKAAAAPKISGADAKAANPIDAFILARLEKEKIQPSPLAQRETLIRRVSLDLTGLPPTVEEVDAFVKDNDPTAYDRLVDRLLESPHYGERWGRWWLDQARYADSNGYSIDAPRSIWPYRDWVVRAMNTDMPFDEFTIEQLAGDLLPKPTIDQQIATGFHRNTQVNGEGGIDVEQFRIDAVFDRVATTGSVWLGLTIGCCQCHNHKFDPISQKEYYQFFAFFNNQEQDGHGGTKTSTLVIPDAKTNPAALAAEKKSLEKKLAEILPARLEAIAQWEATLTPEVKKQLKPPVAKAVAVPAAKRKFAQLRAIYEEFAFNDSEFKGLNDRLTELEKEEASQVTTLVMRDLPQPRETHVFVKGDFTRPTDIVTPGTPAILPPLQNTTGKTNRLDLARWLVSPQNPLTARVIMNRVWAQYFGKGIVETENDFGTQGLAPVNQELLDWLAVQFMNEHWSLKAMHRWIVTSDTYKRSSKGRSDLALKDPNNRLLSHQNRLRVDAETVRDVCLTATGLLNPKLGGPPVYPPQPESAMTVGQVKRPWPTSTGGDRCRRALYTFYFRATPHPELSVFDEPDAFTTCTRRIRSNTPLQSLTLLNDTAYFEFAQAMEKVIQEQGLAVAFRRCMARQPSAMELERLSALEPLAAARVLLNLDETITRE